MHALSFSGGPGHILCLGAHSDDIEIGCGGALLTLLKRHPDTHVDWVVFSGNAARAAEARRSAAAWLRGVSHSLSLFTFRDGFFPSEIGAIKEAFEALKAGPAPGLIFTHRREDAHQDHRTLAQLSWNTWRNHTILEYEIPKWDGDLRTPNVYVPVDRAHVKRKTTLLMRHFGTQRNKHWFAPETFEGLMRIRGLECASPSGYAEGFHGPKLVLA
jgi:LmbE family N-acetylglucosaminyl deacetylase